MDIPNTLNLITSQLADLSFNFGIFSKTLENSQIVKKAFQLSMNPIYSQLRIILHRLGVPRKKRLKQEQRRLALISRVAPELLTDDSSQTPLKPDVLHHLPSKPDVISPSSQTADSSEFLISEDFQNELISRIELVDNLAKSGASEQKIHCEVVQHMKKHQNVQTLEFRPSPTNDLASTTTTTTNELFLPTLPRLSDEDASSIFDNDLLSFSSLVSRRTSLKIYKSLKKSTSAKSTRHIDSELSDSDNYTGQSDHYDSDEANSPNEKHDNNDDDDSQEFDPRSYDDDGPIWYNNGVPQSVYSDSD
jgi:hypothetical protein